MSQSTSAARWPRALAIALGGLAGLCAVAAVTLAVALAGLHHLSSHLSWGREIHWLWRSRAEPQVGRWLSAGLVAAFGLGLALAIGIADRFRPSLHGAARWAKEREVARAGLRATSGIVLGRLHGRPLVLGGEEHVVVYAPTRTGKGVGVVIPNLLSWPGSVVVLDVKGENWTASAGFRAAHGQAVFRFDPLDRQGRTARFNPLGHIPRDDPIAVIEELQKIATMLFPAPINADPFWAEAARTGFIGVGAYLAETADRRFSLGEIYRELAQADPRGRLKAIIEERRTTERPLSPSCEMALSDFCSTSENTYASIRQSITTKLSLFLSPSASAATEVSDFDLRDLRDRPMSIYLAVSPDNLPRVAPLYSLVAQQLVELSCRSLPSPSEHRIPVLVLLDEFARLGPATSLAHAFAYVAAYGLRLLPVLQSPAQLRGLYGPELAEEVLTNCGAEVTFTPKDLKTATELSARLGNYTYKALSRSRPGLFSSRPSTPTETDQRRALRLPQELMAMDERELLVLRAGLPAVRGRKIRYFEEEVFRRRLVPAPTLPARPPPPASAPAATPSPTPPSEAPTGETPAARNRGLEMKVREAQALAQEMRARS